MKAWTVYLRNKAFDIVYYNEDCDKEYVRTSLINHDGYHPNIKVVECK